MAAIAGAVGASANSGTGNGTKPPSLQFLGQAIIPTGTTFAGTTIGGLSSITYDASRGVYYSLSDDQSQINPARFYTLGVNVSDGHLDNGDVTFTGVTTLQAPGGGPYAPASLDPEGLTLTKDGELIVTSEGITNSGIPPFVRRYSLGGAFLGDLPVPAAFLPPNATHGVRQNLAFEAAAVAPDGRHLFVGMENALTQDGPAATSRTGARRASSATTSRPAGSSGRTSTWTTRWPSRRCRRRTSPLTASSSCSRSTTSTCSRWSGRSRSARPGPGTRSSSTTCRSRGRRTSTASTASSGSRSCSRRRRRWCSTCARSGIPLDNVEGMTLGPKLPDGRQSLVLVSDNNFAASQFTQFLLFAIE